MRKPRTLRVLAVRQAMSKRYPMRYVTGIKPSDDVALAKWKPIWTIPQPDDT